MGAEDSKEALIQLIIEHADKDWIRHFIDDVVEFDWGAELKRFPEDTLRVWVKELGIDTGVAEAPSML